MRIGIIGAGHAGVEAARQAAAGGASVVLFSSEPFVPYFRPRVVALAFGRVEIDAIGLKPLSWYRENGIDLRRDSPVSQVDVQAKEVMAGGRTEHFDSLVIAAGAAPVILPFVRSLPADIIPLWDAKGALAIRERLATTKRIVIIGGGISGVEAAAYARAAGIEVTVIEKADRLMSQQLCTRAAGILARILEDKGAVLMTNRSVAVISKDDDELSVRLDNGSEIRCDLALTTVGATRHVEIFRQAGLTTDWGIVVDETLSTSASGVFACGDVAQRDHIRTSSVMRAVHQGRLAGTNAVAAAMGRPLERSLTPVAPLSFMHDDIEIHAIGPAADDGLQERLLCDPDSSIHRSIYLENGILRGIQMIGTREDFQQMTTLLGQLWESEDEHGGHQ
jgi:3-phenylpropionate/trans-cinnamate dioxygenase ferredoxin reductase component